ncbi:conserved hypothetical protein [Ixodes scapularis]|uniref:Uncharacterized protein n=1 Tax=Ixodes scapularis TaxID=6945 RepID=B7PLB2_IXOSC|nr:conserved hypothetical protein [Ixodes scapularis]|eukprot:XP_002434560.1 conserved hypothetical protein [Ixodes scapularis]
MTLREHSSWIVDVHLSVRERRITSGCVTGRRTWSETGRVEEQVFYSRCPSVPSCLAFHPYEPELCVANKDSYTAQSCHSNDNPPQTRITALRYLNAHDLSLLLTGLGAGMVLDWDQQTTTLIASGDVRVIRVWDTGQEKKILVRDSRTHLRYRWPNSRRAVPPLFAFCRVAGTNNTGRRRFPEREVDMPTGADYPITSLSTDHQGSLLVAGCGDGTIRVYDRRLPPADW